MRPEVPIESIRAQAFEIPTDKPEADGTIRWNSTVLVLVEVAAPHPACAIWNGFTITSA